MTTPYSLCQLAGLGLAGLLSCASAVADENTAQAGPKSPWGGNLSTYLWTAGLAGDFSAGGRGGSVDANFGGFGADNVSFTGGLMGLVGYRASLFGVPASVEAGYRAIRYNLDPKGNAAANATLNGPFLGLTGYW